jgi:cytochrome c oxidase subunit 4
MRAYLLAFAGLLGLVALTVALAFVPLGAGNLWIGLALAGMQAALIAGVFMEWRRGDVPQRLALLVGIIWLSFLLVLVGADIGVRAPGVLLLH